MRTPPNALNVFGTTGATGTARTAPSTALAELNGNRLARGTAPAAARPNAKNLRVESPPLKTPNPGRRKVGAKSAVKPGLFGPRIVANWNGPSLPIPAGWTEHRPVGSHG